MTETRTPRRARIVATIGPASRAPETLRAMVEAGMNVARLNCSHGSNNERAEVIDAVRRIADDAGRPVAVLLDLQGPKIRTGCVRLGETFTLRAGDPFAITAEPVEGDARRIATTYPELIDDVEAGMTVLLADGMIQLHVDAVRERALECTVVFGGELRDHMGINVPAAHISAPSFTDADRENLRFGITRKVDYVALSFVRCADDIRRTRAIIADAGADIPIIAKIERREAIDNLDAIVDAADGVMVARGDLGVETSSADVPILQKRIIRAAGRRMRIDITATQMLESMIHNPRPTRAEAADVANAVFDGTDAVMLSGESATGSFPVESVATMARIVCRAEEYMAEYGAPRPPSAVSDVAAATAGAACLAADELGAAAIVVLTRSGRTARMVAQLRPRAPLIALTPNAATWRRLALVWGVRAGRIDEAPDAAAMLAATERWLLDQGGLAPGDVVVITSGTTDVAGATNIMKITTVGRP